MKLSWTYEAAELAMRCVSSIQECLHSVPSDDEDVELNQALASTYEARVAVEVMVSCLRKLIQR